MIIKTLITATGLALAATAATIPARSTDSSAGVRLWANSTYPGGAGPEVQGFELSYAPTDDCLADVLLVPAGQGTPFEANNDTVGVAHFDGEDSPPAGMVIPLGGTATVPIGGPVQLKCSAGTPGVVLTDKGLDYPEETRPNGSFMACRDRARDRVFLSFYRAGQRPLYGCTVVQLFRIY
ncbi:hypothetical protein CSOJ01_06729 [Colletotrichum sojae]|uniref:DUF7907 domain-containing protein n=1 Tax=Colletotrichum sojae TaxID=2175907 RepID=A0A8H6MUR4_9PEZI|nr:hypothetical protein CSOJ01_06729 [Colletotrichum sojae]